MMRNKSLFWKFGVISSAMACPFLMGTCKPGKNDKKMNILFIMTDDHSFQTIGEYGAVLNKTPNIDRIGREGVVFERGYVANSISGPSRACILTGKHSHKNGFINNHTTFDGEQQTFPKLLRQAGYETAMIGKWHLTSEPTGFDYWNILVGQGEYYNPHFIDNGNPVRYDGYVTTVTTDLALDWLKNKHDKSKPFCMMLHHKAPHRTWMPDLQDLGKYDDVTFPLPDNFYDDYKGRSAAEKAEMRVGRDLDVVYDCKMMDEEGLIRGHREDLRRWADSIYREALTPEQAEKWNNYYRPIIEDFKKAKRKGKALSEWKFQRYMRDYCSVINSVDRNIGRILDYLEKEGLAENTLVIYTSDQGFYMGEHGWFDKRFMYEESFRTPILAKLPGGASHKRIKELVQNIDFAPTFLELAGVKVPEDIQGKSLLPLLEGKHPENWRKSLYYHFYEFPGEHNVNRHYGMTDGRYKLIHFYNDTDSWEFYDLEKDPSEMVNLIDSPEYKTGIEEAKHHLDSLVKYYDDDLKE